MTEIMQQALAALEKQASTISSMETRHYLTDWHLQPLRDEVAAVCSKLRATIAGDPPSAPDGWAVISSNGEGVMFTNEADARWTHTGTGPTGCLGVPVIGEEFRELNDGEQLELVRVRVLPLEGPAT